MLLSLLPYLTVVANLAIVLAVLLGINQRVRRLSARSSKEEKAQQAEIARLAGEIVELKTRVSTLEESEKTAQVTPLPDPATAGQPRTGINNTLRSKVLKMHRLGQPADRIAGSLRVPRGEVDLLVKVHQIVMRPYEEVVLSPMGVEVPEKS
jgi:hypothetical protein